MIWVYTFCYRDILKGQVDDISRVADRSLFLNTALLYSALIFSGRVRIENGLDLN